jgi:hypothetical protein
VVAASGHEQPDSLETPKHGELQSVFRQQTGTTMTVNRHYSVIVHQITSPRAVQAFLVVAFGLTIIIMALATMPVPEIMSYSLAAIVGYYFGDSSERLPPLVTNGTSVEHVGEYVDRTLNAGGSVPRSVPVDPVVPEDDDPEVNEIARKARQPDDAP